LARMFTVMAPKVFGLLAWECLPDSNHLAACTPVHDPSTSGCAGGRLYPLIDGLADPSLDRTCLREARSTPPPT
jgi:hypothetical protein